MRVQADGIAFKSSASGQVVQVKHSEIDIVEWLRVARGYEVKVMSREGNVFKFDGFKESVRYFGFVNYFKHSHREYSCSSILNQLTRISAIKKY